jgi:hypothetical protein
MNMIRIRTEPMNKETRFVLIALAVFWIVFFALLAHAECTTRPMDDHGGVVHVCAEVTDFVDTATPQINADELADMLAVAKLVEDDVVVVVKTEGGK